jgi:flagellar basal-body rod modification protein FlgD
MSTASVTNLVSTAPATPPTTATPTGSNALGKDEFLKILVAQLANQDPTQPQDSSQFVAELAQFSGLEAQQNTVNDLNTLLMGQATANQTAATSFIGKDISFQGGAVQWNGATPVAATVNLASAAAKVAVSIADAKGNVVRTLQLGGQAAGNLSVAWDGRNDKGATVPSGSYTLQPAAFDAGGTAISTSLSTTGTVTGVAFQGGVPFLKVGATLVKMSDVTSINERITP